jgi:flagellar biosynthesis protein FlhG
MSTYSDTTTNDRRSVALTKNERSGNNIVCVASGKGGVGKTWLSVTLSHTLAKLGLGTLLFDGDLGLANVDVQLGLMPDRDLGNVVAESITLAEAVMRFPAGGFDVIAGRSGAGTLAMLDSTRIAGLRHDLLSLARRYDRVVLDLGAGVDGSVRTLADAAAILLVVTTDEPTALTDAYAFIKLSAMQNHDIDFRIVVNMAGSARDGERTYAKLLRACEGFLKLSPKLAGVVRRDDKVRDCIRHQTSLLVRHPTSDAARDVEMVVERLGLGR